LNYLNIWTTSTTFSSCTISTGFGGLLLRCSLRLFPRWNSWSSAGSAFDVNDDHLYVG
jgi:hypothetical protein